MPGDDVPECQDCGACCFSDEPTHVPLSPLDLARLGSERRRALTLSIDGDPHMRLVDGHCAALVRSDDLRWVCAIYAVRPDLCRELERGGDACAYERTQHEARARALLGRPLS